jgi:hypothetical protein
MEEISIAEWITHFKNGEFGGLFDNYYPSIPSKTRKLGNIIKDIQPGGKVDLENWYVDFAQACPGEGPMYDIIEFYDIKTSPLCKLAIAMDKYHTGALYAVYGVTPNSRREYWGRTKPMFKADSKKDLIKWLNEPW